MRVLRSYRLAWASPGGAVVLLTLATMSLGLGGCDEATDDGGAGGAGAGLQNAGACDGYWGSPVPVLSLPGGQTLRGGPAIARGGLALFYVTVDTGSSFEFFRASRATTGEPFGAPEAVPELGAVCASGEPHGIDVSEDALRAYVSCHDGASTRSVIALIRASEGAPFVAEGEVATQSASPTLFGAARVSLDERTLYVSATSVGGPPWQATRGAVGGTFGAFAPIAGLEQVALLYPAPSPDGTALFGSTTVDGVPTLAYTARPTTSSAFGALVYLFAGAGYESVPEVSADCRTLYVGTATNVFALWR